MISLFRLCSFLELIKVVYFELSPDKISLFWVFLNSPPETTFEQTFNQEEVIPFPQVKFVFVFRFQRA